MNEAGLSRKRLLTACEASLKRLGTDYVDLFSPHCPDAFTPLEETLETLDTLVRQGKTRYLGCSNWPAWMTAKAIQMQKDRGWARFISAQLYYSLLGRDIEMETVPMLRDAGAGLMVWSPLSGGFLSGKYTWITLKTPKTACRGLMCCDSTRHGDLKWWKVCARSADGTGLPRLRRRLPGCWPSPTPRQFCWAPASCLSLTTT